MENRILYHSTNRQLDTDEITGFKEKVTFKKPLFMGQAPDKGLFMPTVIPELSKEEIMMLKEKPYPVVAYEILKRFLTPEIDEKS